MTKLIQKFSSFCFGKSATVTSKGSQNEKVFEIIFLFVKSFTRVSSWKRNEILIESKMNNE